MTENEQTMSEDTSKYYCSICYDPIGDEPEALEHVVAPNPHHDTVQEFINNIVMPRHCDRCGSWYNAWVRLRPGCLLAVCCCPKCRAEKPPLRDVHSTRLWEKDVVERGRMESHVVEHGEYYAALK